MGSTLSMGCRGKYWEVDNLKYQIVSDLKKKKIGLEHPYQRQLIKVNKYINISILLYSKALPTQQLGERSELLFAFLVVRHTLGSGSFGRHSAGRISFSLSFSDLGLTSEAERRWLTITKSFETRFW